MDDVQRKLRLLFNTRDRSFSTYAKFAEKLTFLHPLYAHISVQIKGLRNASFSENFAYALN